MNLSHLVWSVFVFSSVVVAAQQPYIVNATIQKFRLDYRRFKSEWLKKADSSFFDVYNALNSTLGEIVAPFEDVKTNWTRMCRNFTEASLDNDTRLVFDTLCEKDVLLLENIILEREKWLTMLFYGEVTTGSPSAVILKKLFTHMELQMSEMWQIYASNSSCVETMIESYLPSYVPVIENVFFLNNETIANISETFKEAKVVGNDSLSIIGRFRFRVATECADAAVLDKCISFFVSIGTKPSNASLIIAKLIKFHCCL